jgi:hypothetical protein
MAFMMNKLATIHSCEIILEKYKYFLLPKIIVKFRCALYSYVYYTVLEQLKGDKRYSLLWWSIGDGDKRFQDWFKME